MIDRIAFNSILKQKTNNNVTHLPNLNTELKIIQSKDDHSVEYHTLIDKYHILYAIPSMNIQRDDDDYAVTFSEYKLLEDEMLGNLFYNGDKIDVTAFINGSVKVINETEDLENNSTDIEFDIEF